MTFVPSQAATVRAAASSSAFCPLRPNACPGSDAPFSVEALRAYVEYGRRVLNSGDLPVVLPVIPVVPATVRGTMRSAQLRRAQFALRAQGGPTGAELRRAREASGLGQRTIATAAGLSKSGLHALETGTHLSTPELRQRILDVILAEAEALRVTPRRCVFCAAALPVPSQSDRRYCGDSCYEKARTQREREWGQRVREQAASIVQRCVVCAAVLPPSLAGHRVRKYCSSRCGYDARYARARARATEHAA